MQVMPARPIYPRPSREPLPERRPGVVWREGSCTQGLCITLEGLKIISFTDSSQVCQILEMLLCLWDRFAGDTQPRGAGMLTPPCSKMEAPQCFCRELPPPQPNPFAFAGPIEEMLRSKEQAWICLVQWL